MLNGLTAIKHGSGSTYMEKEKQHLGFKVIGGCLACLLGVMEVGHLIHEVTPVKEHSRNDISVFPTGEEQTKLQNVVSTGDLGPPGMGITQYRLT